MSKKVGKKIKFIITIAIVVCFVWFLVVSPMMKFHANEKKLEDAARRYFELNPNELPTGERVKTVGLGTLYHKAFIEKDLYIPYTHKTCSIDDSWVKIRRENGEYKYYTYLQCGLLSSIVDHKGPTIQLNGDKNITIGIGEEFKDAGVKSVVDNADGKISTEQVTIKGEVNTSKVGTYEIQYIAFDQLKNRSVVTRTVQVVQKLNSTVKKLLNGASNFKGDPTNNYIRLSNMMYQIYGLDDQDDVILVAEEDVSYVNYSKIDEWLGYYYKNLNETVQKLLVEKQYCNMALTETTLDTTQCNGYTDKKKIYIPSAIEVNKAAGDGNFMKSKISSWVANPAGENKAYFSRNVFGEHDKRFISDPVDYNYGVRPMMTIQGDTLITGGRGTYENPYVIGDTKKGKGGSLLNDRHTGEYVYDGTIYWRIIEAMDDGTTKVISINSIGNHDFATCPAEDKGPIAYNPKTKGTIGYFVNNYSSQYISSDNFSIHPIKVPIYKDKIMYGEEVETKEYKVMFSAPNMYELFSAKPYLDNFCQGIVWSYWLLNSSNNNRMTGVITDIGVPRNVEVPARDRYGIRVVGFMKKNTTITSGNGTLESPYRIK